MSTYLVDALMLGHLPHSALSIAASSLGNTIYYTLAFCVIGLLTGLETFVAQAFGREELAEANRILFQAGWIVLVGTPLVAVLTLLSLLALPLLGTPGSIVAESSIYLHALVWSTPALLLYMALRRFLQSIDRVMLVTMSLVTAAVVNLVGDWAFLYGHLHFRRMGVAGSAWATCVVRVYMLAVLLPGVWLAVRNSGGMPGLRALLPDRQRLHAMLRIGWPAALGTITDLGISTCMSVMGARLGTTLLAAHQVVLDLDAFVYMIPAGLAYATVVRVGQCAGRNQLAEVRRAANASLLLGLGTISAAAILFAGLPRLWAGLYSNDAAVVRAAVPIFLLCGFLQCGDAASVILGSALTGIGDTRTPFLVNTVWYWVLGMPLSYWLTFHAGLALRGLWMGRMIAAIGTASTLIVLWRLRVRDADKDLPTPKRSSVLMPLPVK